MFYNAQNKLIRLFDIHSTSASEAKQKPFPGEGMKIFTFKQLFKGLPIEFAQVKPCITSENLLSKIREIIYSLN